MKKAICLIACFSIAVFAQNEQEQQPPPPQQAYPPEQQVQPQQQQYPPQQYQQYPPQQYQQYPPQQYPPQQYQQYPPQQYPPQQYPPQQQAYPQQPQPQEQNKNFSAGNRWATWGINMVVPGLGSYIIMKDVWGGVIQDVLFLGGIVFVLTGVHEYEEDEYDTGEIITSIRPTYYLGLGMLGANFIYNIVRSATYNKPSSVAHRYEGFNFAVLPNKRGEFMPYVLYNKAF